MIAMMRDLARRRTALTGAALALVVLGLHACGGDDGGPMEPEPTPGFLQVRVATPGVGSAGALFEVSGPALDSLRALPGYEVFEPGQGATRRLIVAGSLRAGVVAEFWVPDTGRLADYSVQFLEVVAPGSYETIPTDGFRADLILR